MLTPQLRSVLTLRGWSQRSAGQRAVRSHLDLLEGHGRVVQQVPGPVHLAELAPPDLLLDLEVGQRVVAHVWLQRFLKGTEHTHKTHTHVSDHTTTHTNTHTHRCRISLDGGFVIA